ncbi:MAG TPA: phage holin family protein [Kofleriaceae bacterium]|nr:phage holin family protein [Kofleriaceae bacterium]
MALTRSEPRGALARVGPGTAAGLGQESVADLAARLAQESAALGAVELRRIGAEARRRGGQASRVAAAALLASTCAGAALAVLAVALILYLGRMWQDYAAGALATGVLLLLVALASGWMLLVAIRKLTRGERPGPDQRLDEQLHEQPGERSATHGA